MKNKAKLTLSIEVAILEKAKAVCKQKHLSLSGVIENFLEFFASPTMYCFNCGQQFSTKNSEVCVKCDWLICPNCKTCGCSLDDDTLQAVYQMRRTYEQLLAGRVK